MRETHGQADGNHISYALSQKLSHIRVLPSEEHFASKKSILTWPWTILQHFQEGIIPYF